MIRSLRHDEPLPEGEPRRYVRPDDGYVRLRWKVGVEQYVEEYEHRVVAGRPGPGMDVHHRNGRRSDNRLENLQVMTSAEHDALHAARRRALESRFGGHRSREAMERAGRAEERRQRGAARAQQMRAMREQGATLAQIGAAFGLHTSGVSRWLRDVPR